MSLTDAEILTEIYNNCDPIVPATALYYLDCTDVRGGDAFSHDFCKELSDSRGRVYQLFAGHIGGGKSSELNHLADRMDSAVPTSGQRRFFPVIVNVLEYVEENNGAVEFVLLAVVEALSNILRDRFTTNAAPKPLPAFIENLSELLKTPLRLEDVQVTAGAVQATFKNLRTSPTVRETVMKAVRGNETRLRNAVNEFLAMARLAIIQSPVPDGQHSYSDFVLILDGMDRILRVEGKSAGSESHKALFIEGFNDFINLDASAIYTAPLSLIRSEGNTLSNLYTRDPYVLPMVKTECRAAPNATGAMEHLPYQPGRDRLTQLLQRRMPPGVALAGVITDEVLDELLYYSGGHIRSLLRFMREAALQAGGSLPISQRAARKAVAGNVGVLSGGLDTADYELLAELECSGTHEWNNTNERHKELLEQAYVYEYVNGGEEDFLNSAAQWYAVNPIVRGLNPFKRAVAERIQRTG